MRSLLLGLMAFVAAPAFAEERFAPDNPWFQDFEAACRDGSDMNEECQAGVLGAYAEFAGTEAIACDFRAFWEARDSMADSKTLPVLPWQYGVEFIVQKDGVCTVNP